MGTIVQAARVFHPLAAATVVGLVFAQVYLIAEYVFGDATALGAHMTLGKIVVLFELIVLLTAVIGWWSDWTEVWLSLALVVVGGLRFRSRRISATRRRSTRCTACSRSSSCSRPR